MDWNLRMKTSIMRMRMSLPVWSCSPFWRTDSTKFNSSYTEENDVQNTVGWEILSK